MWGLRKIFRVEHSDAADALALVIERLDEQMDVLKRMDAGFSGLDELLDELRAQSQAIFILIDRMPPP
jgi:hypothetical protein